jgi:PTH1 family peptidyl-tRNA hydrolase
VEWSHNKKIEADLVKLVTNGVEVIFIKPQRLMNNSGRAVTNACRWFDIKNYEDILVIHDDLDIQLGSFKLQRSKSPKQHNGVSSVEDHLQTKDFYRLRIGIENREGFDIPGKEFVLDRLKRSELDKLQNVFDDAMESVISWVQR